jgi:mono/diheme cytochrome c family protein
MRRLMLFPGIFLVVCAAGAQNKPVDKPPAIPAPGKRLYTHYCAACHGTDGRGMGPAAAALKTPPSDLTRLARRNDGKFPYDYVENVLRFGVQITAHGSSDMPTWGPIFGSLENYNEVAVRQHIKDLCDYLASLQQKDS